jgi:hypothetical protein
MGANEVLINITVRSRTWLLKCALDERLFHNNAEVSLRRSASINTQQKAPSYRCHGMTGFYAVNDRVAGLSIRSHTIHRSRLGVSSTHHLIMFEMKDNNMLTNVGV